ncbi:beta-lactamase domain-containing protein [Salinisphaera sp. PC39]|uniref:MBL fold metallo-hydrolase n=1 Tax=Salinisphaera sp. PC39 TaxID=1304156 RepID=UPI00333FAA24
MTSGAALALYCLGTGRGATAVHGDGASSAFLLLVDDSPVLLVDIGFGVVRACRDAFGALPAQILVTHNHSDHAAELPVTLAEAAAAGRRPRVIAGPEVAPRLREHRLHELRSTGRPLSAFCDLVVPDGPCELGQGLRLTLLRARHAEPCYGFLLSRHDRPVLGYGGDSGVCESLYGQVFRAPTVVLDARERGSPEHAGFAEVAAFARGYPDRRVYVTGYGTAAQAPGNGLASLRPGMRLPLAAGVAA